MLNNNVHISIANIPVFHLPEIVKNIYFRVSFLKSMQKGCSLREYDVPFFRQAVIFFVACLCPFIGLGKPRFPTGLIVLSAWARRSHR